MSEYFGYQGGATSRSNTNGQLFWQYAGYACPGEGTQNIVTLGLEGSDTTGTWLIGIYDSDGDLVCSSTSAKSNIDGWLEWTSAELTGTKTLTGGATYRLAVWANGSAGIMRNTAGTNAYDVADYSGGLPATIPAPDDSDGQELNIRCEVETPSGGGSIVPILMSHYRRRRG